MKKLAKHDLYHVYCIINTIDKPPPLSWKIVTAGLKIRCGKLFLTWNDLVSIPLTCFTFRNGKRLKMGTRNEIKLKCTSKKDNGHHVRERPQSNDVREQGRLSLSALTWASQKEARGLMRSSSYLIIYPTMKPQDWESL